MAEQKKNEKAEDGKKAEKKPLNTQLIMQVAFAVLNLACVGVGAFLVYSSTLGYHSPMVTEQALAEERKQIELADASSNVAAGPLIYTMDKFTVNLSGEPKRTIRVEVNLEMLGKDAFEDIMNTDNKARARDKIVRLLNDRSFDDLETIQGKLFLKDRIAMEVNNIIDRGVVKDVYFSEFVVQ